MSHVKASCYRSLKTLTEAEEPAEIGKSLGTGAIATDSFCLQGEKRPEAVGALTNTVQPVLVFDC